MMDSGGDPREGIFPSLGLIVSWLLAVTHSHNLNNIHLFLTSFKKAKQLAAQCSDAFMANISYYR